MKRGIIIELTALLDIVMNLMFLFLVKTTQQMDAVQAQSQSDAAANAALSQQVEELSQENTKLLRKANSYLVFEQNCFILTLSIAGGQAARTVTVESDINPASKITLTWDNGQYAKNLLRAEISQKIKDAFLKNRQFVFIIFQYERDSIYQSDYELIDSVIQEQKVYDNVYFAEYDILEEGTK
jgi:hypothetical protein